MTIIALAEQPGLHGPVLRRWIASAYASQVKPSGVHVAAEITADGAWVLANAAGNISAGAIRHIGTGACTTQIHLLSVLGK